MVTLSKRSSQMLSHDGSQDQKSFPLLSLHEFPNAFDDEMDPYVHTMLLPLTALQTIWNALCVVADYDESRSTAVRGCE